MSDRLKRHKEIWQNKKILRGIYTEWYKQIIKDLKQDQGKIVELGSGSGNFKEFYPDVISSDIEKCEWLDMHLDAHHMPFGNNSISNIVMIDVLHHLSCPMTFFREASRVLKKGGRIILIEPYPSPFSLRIYRMVHPEPFLMNIDYFTERMTANNDPWNANQAVAYLLFFKYRKRFQEIFSNDLSIITRYRMDCILYPASGGFEHKAIIPEFFVPFAKYFEILLTPLRRLFAFRCYIVIEKK